jgi:DNA-binding LytR/AlgR family response regulator
MIKIALCDDELSVLNELRILLDQYRVECNQEIDYKAFQNPWDLLTDIERGARYDILFLDVVMPAQNGIDVAAEIRNYDNNVKIIFLTSSKEFAVQSYAVGAYFYQLKPIWKESFFHLMDSAIASCEKERTQSVILRCKNGITRIELRHIEFCEVIHRTLFIHLTNGQVEESAGHLDELSKKLEPFGNFLRAHRSFLVNLEYVKNISSRMITMSSLSEIPIPHKKYQEIKDKYLEFAFQNRQVTI